MVDVILSPCVCTLLSPSLVHERIAVLQTQLRYMDNIVDLFYHIKYMFTGDSVKAEVEHIIRNLRPELQLRLRFITHLNVSGSQQNFETSGTGSTSQQAPLQQSQSTQQQQSQQAQQQSQQQQQQQQQQVLNSSSQHQQPQSMALNGQLQPMS